MLVDAIDVNSVMPARTTINSIREKPADGAGFSIFGGLILVSASITAYLKLGFVVGWLRIFDLFDIALEQGLDNYSQPPEPLAPLPSQPML